MNIKYLTKKTIIFTTLLTLSSTFQNPLFATPAPPENVSNPVDRSHTTTEINGLELSGSAQSLRWIKKTLTKQANFKTWINKLAADQKTIQAILQEESAPDSDPSYLKELREKRLECPICLEKFEDKKNLAASHCGHLFCEDCLFEVYSDALPKKKMNPEDSDLQFKNKTAQECPLCRDQNWHTRLVRVQYEPGSEILVRASEVDGTTHLQMRGKDAHLGRAFQGLSPLTWFEPVQTNPSPWACLSPKGSIHRKVKLMSRANAEAYCSARSARLPTLEDFDQLRRDLGYPLSSHFDQYNPRLSAISKNSFWSNTPVAENKSLGYLFNGSDGQKEQIELTKTAAVICVRD